MRFFSSGISLCQNARCNNFFPEARSSLLRDRAKVMRFAHREVRPLCPCVQGADRTSDHRHCSFFEANLICMIALFVRRMFFSHVLYVRGLFPRCAVDSADSCGVVAIDGVLCLRAFVRVGDEHLVCPTLPRHIDSDSSTVSYNGSE